MPTVVIANDFPMISCISLARIIAVSRDFLVVAKRACEDVRVQVSVGGNVLHPDDLPALNFSSTLTDFSRRSLNHPVRVHVVSVLNASHGLLATARAIFHVMGMQSASIVNVEQLDYTSTCNITRFGGWN